MTSHIEDELALQIKLAGLPVPVREFAAINGRKFRFDFAFPKHGLLLECQGSTWKGKEGGHSSGSGIARDCEKMDLAVIAGWKVMHVTGDQVKSGQALKWLQEYFK